MNLGKLLKLCRQEESTCMHIPILSFISPSVFITKKQSLGSVIKLSGVPFVVESNEELNVLHEQLNSALNLLDENYTVYVHIHRKKGQLIFENDFRSDFAKKSSEKYHAQFEKNGVFVNDIYLTILLNENIKKENRRWNTIIKNFLSEREIAKEVHHVLEENKKRILDMAQQISTSLSCYGPSILGMNDKGESELMNFFGLFPNIGNSLNYKQPAQIPPFGKEAQKVNSEYVEFNNGDMAHLLCHSRLFFSEYIQSLSSVKSDAKYAVMLSLKKYPVVTGNVILDPLLNLECEHIATHSFTPMRREKSLSEIYKKKNKLINANDLAISQQSELSQLEDEITSEAVQLGYHQHTIMVIGESKDAVNDALREVVKVYSLSGIAVIKETMGQELAFWSQIPGNQHLFTRLSLISSHNFSDFCSLHNYSTGYFDQNHLGKAMSVLKTPSRTPYYFNVHTKGTKTNPSKGHTLIIGGNGSGKNVLASFIDMELGRYDNRTFVIERNQASRIYILASGNSDYYTVSPTHQNGLRLNPFKLKDGPDNRRFIKDWVGALCLRGGELTLSAKIQSIISEAVDYVFEHLEPQYRQLSHFIRLLPVDFERWFEIKKWVRKSETHQEGEYAWLFDNEKDTLSLDLDKIGFDVTYLIDNTPSTISTPVYMYLLHVMRNHIENQTQTENRLTTIIIDEFWQILKSPYWINVLENWLPTVRKQNAHFILMTQSAETVINSTISKQVLDNLATMLLFGNPNGKYEAYIKGLGLSETEFEFIYKTSPDSRSFLLKQNLESVICKLDLSAMPEVVNVFSANQKSNQLLDELISKYGRDPLVWLPAFEKQVLQ